MTNRDAMKLALYMADIAEHSDDDEKLDALLDALSAFSLTIKPITNADLIKAAS